LSSHVRLEAFVIQTKLNLSSTDIHSIFLAILLAFIAAVQVCARFVLSSILVEACVKKNNIITW